MKKNNVIFCLILIALSSFSALAQEGEKISPSEENGAELITTNPDTSRVFNVAIVQGLNKTTAKTSILEIPVDAEVNFGQISIIAHKCLQAPLDQKPESKILLEVLERKNNEPKKRIFYGWMFASSPSISGLEHPIYDLIALSCKNK